MGCWNLPAYLHICTKSRRSCNEGNPTNFSDWLCFENFESLFAGRCSSHLATSALSAFSAAGSSKASNTSLPVVSTGSISDRCEARLLVLIFIFMTWKSVQPRKVRISNGRAMENHHLADHKMVIKGSKCAPGRGNLFERPRRTTNNDFCFHSGLGGLCLGREKGGGGKSRDFKIYPC